MWAWFGLGRTPTPIPSPRPNPDPNPNPNPNQGERGAGVRAAARRRVRPQLGEPPRGAARHGARLLRLARGEHGYIDRATIISVHRTFVPGL